MGVRSVNNSLQQFLDTFVRSGTDAVTPAPVPAGLTATGGVISDYVSGPAIYRAHIFTSSGTFTVSALATDPTIPNNVEYLVVAGGGGGGAGGAGSAGDATNGGYGGLGRQVPSTFRDPVSRVGAPGPTGPVPATNPDGDQSGLYWVAGGGAGQDFGPGENPGGGPGGPYAGGGNSSASSNTPPAIGYKGSENTGGGGGGSYATNTSMRAGNGGSGIVLIAYPS